MSKACFKCGIIKELDQFYKHSKMSDGHLNKCKTCAKNDVKENYSVKILNPDFIVKERKRGRQKYHRLYQGTGKANLEANRKWKEKYPEKEVCSRFNCHRLVEKGFNAHHWSYKLEHAKDIIPLTVKAHSKAHRFLVYDQERMMYRRYDNNKLLDTKIDHLEFISFCILNLDD